MRLSVLDQSTAAQGRAQDVAIRETLALARHCDALGYHRYWVSEHHNSDSIVGTAPEVLMAAIAATTHAHPRRQRRRHAAALLGAEGRRAVPRAGGASRRGASTSASGARPAPTGSRPIALNPHANAADEFPQQVRELQRWVAGEPLPDEPSVPRRSRRIRRDRRARRSGCSAAPTTARSSPRISACPTRSPISSATAAASRRRSRSTARNYRPERAPSASRRRRSASGRWPPTPKPRRGGCCTTREFWRVGFEQGIRKPLVSPEDAAAHPYTDAERAIDRGAAPRRRSSAPATRWPRGCTSSRSGSSSTSWSSSRGRTTRRRGIARTSCWPRRSGSHCP